MKNNYTIKDNIVEMEVYLKGDKFITLFDLKFLPVLKFLNTTWSCVKPKKSNNIYVKTRYKGVDLTLHTLVCGKKEGMVVDHINRNSLDNRSENLRLVTYSINALNRHNMHRHNSKSKERFIHWNKTRNKYQVSIYSTETNKRKNIGYFETVEEAIVVRDSYLFE